MEKRKTAGKKEGRDTGKGGREGQGEGRWKEDEHEEEQGV